MYMYSTLYIFVCGAPQSALRAQSHNECATLPLKCQSWRAGSQLTKQTLLGALLRESFICDIKGWALKQELARLQGGVARFVGRGLRSKSGDARELKGAKVCAISLPCCTRLQRRLQNA